MTNEGAKRCDDGQIDIVERLVFDAARCELQFSKGVAENIKEGISLIERLRQAKLEMADEIKRLIAKGEAVSTMAESYGQALEAMGREVYRLRAELQLAPLLTAWRAHGALSVAVAAYGTDNVLCFEKMQEALRELGAIRFPNAQGK